jgi:hypothetical protein
MKQLYIYFSSVFIMFINSCDCPLVVVKGDRIDSGLLRFASSDAIRGNKVIIEKDIAVSDYSEIHFSVPGELVYRQMQEDTLSFRISTDENILPLLDIEIDGTCLKIKRRKHVNIHPSQLRIYTCSAHLNGLRVAGSGKVYLKEKITSDRMSILVSGSGDVASDDLSCKEMDMNISGSGNIRLKGSADRVSCSISGSGSVHAFDFAAREMTCKISGSGNMDVHVGEKLTARVSGSGNIRYSGNPQTDNTVGGSGSIKHKQF